MIFKQNTPYVPTLEDVLRGLSASEMADFIHEEQLSVAVNGIIQSRETILERLKSRIEEPAYARTYSRNIERIEGVSRSDDGNYAYAAEV